MNTASELIISARVVWDLLSYSMQKISTTSLPSPNVIPSDLFVSSKVASNYAKELASVLENLASLDLQTTDIFGDDEQLEYFSENEGDDEEYINEPIMRSSFRDLLTNSSPVPSPTLTTSTSAKTTTTAGETSKPTDLKKEPTEVTTLPHPEPAAKPAAEPAAEPTTVISPASSGGLHPPSAPPLRSSLTRSLYSRRPLPPLPSPGSTLRESIVKRRKFKLDLLQEKEREERVIEMISDKIKQGKIRTPIQEAEIKRTSEKEKSQSAGEKATTTTPATSEPSSTAPTTTAATTEAKPVAPPAEKSVLQSSLESFRSADDLEEIFKAFTKVKEVCGVPTSPSSSTQVNKFFVDSQIQGLALYEHIKEATMHATFWCKQLWRRLDSKMAHDDYRVKKQEQNESSQNKHYNVLIVGAGPAGLSAALECALVGSHSATIHVVEKRNVISRNNILHLWPYSMEYLKILGAKTFYAKFGTGAIDHIGTRQIQRVLLKLCLLLGVKVWYGHEFVGLQKSQNGVQVTCKPPMTDVPFDYLIGADGAHSTIAQKLEFKQKETSGTLSLGITVNFVNRHGKEESTLREFGLSYVFEQEFFRKLLMQHKADLENLVYYRGETHYMVMTAKKANLIAEGVFNVVEDDVTKLIHRDNVNSEKLQKYLRGIAKYVGIPDSCEFVTLTRAGRKQEGGGTSAPIVDVDMQLFDFSVRRMAEDSVKMIPGENGSESNGLLCTLIGDALLEPFWPLGTGCNRAILGAQDAAWTLKQLCELPTLDSSSVQQLISDRNSNYLKMKNILAGSVSTPYSKCSLNPVSRYGTGNTYLGIQ